jgi:hypothetical protein
MLEGRVPASLERVIGRALQKSRKSRYQTIGELANDLKEVKLELELEARMRNSRAPGDRASINFTAVASSLSSLDGTEHPTLQVSASPVPTESRPNNLSVLLNPLIGRGGEEKALKQLLVSEDVRLVTLTGPGGTGKSTLSLKVARDLLSDFPHGAFL